MKIHPLPGFRSKIRPGVRLCYTSGQVVKIDQWTETNVTGEIAGISPGLTLGSIRTRSRNKQRIHVRDFDGGQFAWEIDTKLSITLGQWVSLVFQDRPRGLAIGIINHTSGYYMSMFNIYKRGYKPAWVAWTIPLLVLLPIIGFVALFQERGWIVTLVCVAIWIGWGRLWAWRTRSELNQLDVIKRWMEQPRTAPAAASEADTNAGKLSNAG